MVDAQTVRLGGQALATAIVELMEDALPATTRPATGPFGLLMQAERLSALRSNIATLGAAMGVLARRGRDEGGDGR